MMNYLNVLFQKDYQSFLKLKFQFGFRKTLGTSDALLTLVHEVQPSLDFSAESRLVSLDFSSAVVSITKPLF